MKLLHIILKHKVIFILIVIVILVTIFLIYSQSSNRKSSINAPSWNSLTPGQSTLNDVIKKLGTPLSSTQTQNGQELFFKSESPSRSNIAIVQSDKLQLIRTVNLVNQLTISDLTSSYGQSEMKLYGDLSDIGYNLFASPSKGVAYFANPIAGNILEIWYFVPTTQQVFLNSFGSTFSLSSPIPKGNGE